MNGKNHPPLQTRPGDATVGMDSDDDAPPALSSLSSQLAATARIGVASGTCTAAQTEEVAEVTAVGGHSGRQAGSSSGGRRTVAERDAPRLRKGFLDAPRQKKAPRTAADDIPVLRATRAPPPGAGPQIPDFLRVQPDEQAKQYQAVINDLTERLKPTEETVQEVMQNEEMATAFDDAEIMAAVAEIAQRPELMKTKYARNEKVRKFYMMMMGHMGERLMAGGGRAAAAGTA